MGSHFITILTRSDHVSPDANIAATKNNCWRWPAWRRWSAARFNQPQPHSPARLPPRFRAWSKPKTTTGAEKGSPSTTPPPPTSAALIAPPKQLTSKTAATPAAATTSPTPTPANGSATALTSPVRRDRQAHSPSAFAWRRRPRRSFPPGTGRPAHSSPTQHSQHRVLGQLVHRHHLWRQAQCWPARPQTGLRHQRLQWLRGQHQLVPLRHRHTRPPANHPQRPNGRCRLQHPQRPHSRFMERRQRRSVVRHLSRFAGRSFCRRPVRHFIRRHLRRQRLIPHLLDRRPKRPSRQPGQCAGRRHALRRFRGA